MGIPYVIPVYNIYLEALKDLSCCDTIALLICCCFNDQWIDVTTVPFGVAASKFRMVLVLRMSYVVKVGSSRYFSASMNCHTL